MYLIIQKIYEKNNKILKEGLKDVLNGADVSTLTGAIKDFTDILGKELFSEIVTQIENLVFEDSKRKNEYEAVRFAEKSLITKNGKAKLLLDNKQGFIETMTGQTTYTDIEKKIQEICKKFEWGYRIKVKDGNFYFSLYKGEDRSDKVVFSSDFENLQSTKYTSDKTNIKNVALIGGEGEGSKRSKEVAGQGIGNDRYETFVDAKDISKSITFEELTKMYPLTKNGGQGKIETLGDTAIYKMNYIDIEIIDDNQLLRLKEQYPNGEEIENKYYRIHNIAIAELENSAPEDGSNVVLKDIVYSTYLLNKGYEKLSEYGATESFEGEIEPSTTFEYKKDYFLRRYSNS